MKMHHINTSCDTQNVGETQNFSIKSVGFVMTALSGLYSNVTRIITQEYASNARDAHREVGKGDVPIHLTLPTALDPYLKIRDFGPSITPERVQDVFVVFGESTKHATNDQTGGFGIGAKCGLAYNTRTFTVRSITDGVERTYQVYIGEEDVPAMTLLSENTTEEETGTEIIIPVAQDDVHDIRQHVNTVMSHWEVKPHITNAENVGFGWIEHTIAEKGDGWVVFQKKYGSPQVLLDDIPYPLAIEQIKNLPKEHRRIRSTPLGIIFNTGEVTPAYNRENLKYDNETCDILRKKIAEIYDQFKMQIEDDIANCTNLYEANLRWEELSKTLNKHHIVEAIDWQGHQVTGKIEGQPDATIYVYDRDNYDPDTNALRKPMKDQDLVFRTNTLLLYNDETNTRPSVARIKTVFDTTSYDAVQIIHAQTLNGIRHWGTFTPVLNIQNITDYAKKKTPRTGGGGVVTNCYVYDKTRYRNRWRAHQIDLTNDEGIYVPIHRGESQYDTLVMRITEMFNVEVFGIPVRYIERVKKNEGMIHALEWTKNKFIEVEAHQSFSPEVKDYVHNRNLMLSHLFPSRVSQLIKDNAHRIHWPDLMRYHEYSNKVYTAQSQDYSTYRALAYLVGKEISHTNKQLEAWYEKFGNLLPLLKFPSSATWSQNIIDDMVDYINMKAKQSGVVMEDEEKTTGLMFNVSLSLPIEERA
jgi:hypothetical protein